MRPPLSFSNQHQMASSTQNPHHHQHLPTTFAATAAPPPTPSSHSNPSSVSNPPDFLSHLLHRLPPSLSLSLPTGRSSPLSSSTTVTPLIVSLSDPSSLLSASTQHGFFHLAHHPIPSHLPISAESTALSLFALPHNEKQLLFPSNWPLGHEINEDDDEAGGDAAESFCLDSSFSTESGNEFNFECLREFTNEMEMLGLKVVEELASAVGFSNPSRNDLRSQLWISDGVNKPGRVYPYAVALHYQIRSQKQKYHLLSDSGRVCVSGLADSVFVTLGDIGQVWSNGRVKKVRGRPFPSSTDENPDSPCITMSLLITLPVESTVCPLVPDLVAAVGGNGGDGDDATDNNNGETQMFHSFSFEDYAWRVYHERVVLKDSLLRYRTTS